MTTAELRKAVKAVDPDARVSKVDGAHWTIRTRNDKPAIVQLMPALGLKYDPVFDESEGSRHDWIYVLHVFDESSAHAAKKSVGAVVDEAITTTAVSNDRRTDTPVQLLAGYEKALARARELYASPARKRGEFGWAGAAGRAVATIYGVPGAGDEGFGGDVRRVYKAIAEDLRR